MQRVERHILIDNNNIDNLCFLSKNLYNISNYYIRRRFVKSGRFLSAYSLIKIFTKINQKDFRILSTQTAQQIILLLEKNWKSFFKANKKFNKNSSRFKSRPKLPKFKHKIKGRNIVIFTKQQISIKNGFINFPKKIKLNPIKTKIDNINQIRIIPQATCYVVEVIYEKEAKYENLDINNYLGIDLGVNNLATCVNNIGNNPFIINGRPLKSINQYFNKTRSKFMSYIEDKGFSNRIRKLTHKRNNKINDYLHKTSRFIIDYCVENKISTIIIGNNKNWKQLINIGKKNNQNFVFVPFNKLIWQIEYKAEEVGIKVKLHEESYTSMCSFLDFEEVKKHINYLGKRIKRGLFKSFTGRLINADINGAFNILRKVVPNLFNKDGIEDVVLHPIIINI